jgi:hypothetical protein
MLRRREVAAAPVRVATETVQVISELLRETLLRSDHVEVTEVNAALAAARPALLGLIAGAHLDNEPLVLVAPPVHLSISTVSGDQALALADTTDVPGGAGIVQWTIYMPAADPIGAVVRTAAAGNDHLSAEPAPDESAAPTVGAILDEAALRSRLLGS